MTSMMSMSLLLFSRLGQPQTVVEIFRMFFTTSLIGIIVQETNAYAHHVLGDAAGDKWTDVNSDEISAFLEFAGVRFVDGDKSFTANALILESTTSLPLPPHRRVDHEGSLHGHLEVPPLLS